MKKLLTILLLIIGVNATEDNTLNMTIEEYDKLMLHKAEIALNDFMDIGDTIDYNRNTPDVVYMTAQLKFDRACNAWDLLTKESKKYLLGKYEKLEKTYGFPGSCHRKKYPYGHNDSWYRGHFYNSQ